MSNPTERFPNETPAPAQPDHDEMLDALAAIYERHQADGLVHLDYDTLVFYGQPG